MKQYSMRLLLDNIRAKLLFVVFFKEIYQSFYQSISHACQHYTYIEVLLFYLYNSISDLVNYSDELRINSKKSSQFNHANPMFVIFLNIFKMRHA